MGAVLYNGLTGKRLMPMSHHERNSRRHRFHRLALGAPLVVFVALCRPDLADKTLVGGALFAVFYLLFLVVLEMMAPGYIVRVWNLPVLSGVMVGAIPVEELLFGFGVGAYWSGVYEHLAWHRST